MNRKAKVIMLDLVAGTLTEYENEFVFEYDTQYFESKNNLPISQTLPMTKQIYRSNILFSFFDGLIPEGWLLEIATRNWKINPRDRMGLLLTCCKDCIGAVSIIPLEEA